MDERTTEWLLILARVLLWAAGAVLVLAIVGAIRIATRDAGLGFNPDFEEQSRGVVALGALGGGITAAGVLAGLGAILRVQLDRGR